MPKKDNALKTMNSDLNSFSRRHIGVDKETSIEMLKDIGFASMDDFIQSIVPENIYSAESLNINDELSEAEALRYLEAISKKNKVYKTYIGQGFYNSVTPAPIIRNIFENPGWYTSYTPYQPEIAQGRLEALINYQTMVCDLTGMEIANASLLDEPTAAAEAMTLAKRTFGRRVFRRREPVTISMPRVLSSDINGQEDLWRVFSLRTDSAGKTRLDLHNKITGTKDLDPRRSDSVRNSVKKACHV